MYLRLRILLIFRDKLSNFWDLSIGTQKHGIKNWSLKPGDVEWRVFGKGATQQSWCCASKVDHVRPTKTSASIRQQPRLVNRSSPTLHYALQAQYGCMRRAIPEKQSPFSIESRLRCVYSRGCLTQLFMFQITSSTQSESWRQAQRTAHLPPWKSRQKMVSSLERSWGRRSSYLGTDSWIWTMVR